MTFCTTDTAKAEHIQKYFSSINPMAARIVEVQCNFINSFPKEKWINMSTHDKERALDQCVINPQFASKYRSTKPSSNLPEFYKSVFPKLIVDTGQVFLQQLDDRKKKDTWKDEHSDPFSWETRSQMNMALPAPSKNKKKKKEVVNVRGKVSKRQSNGKESKLNSKSRPEWNGDTQNNAYTDVIKASDKRKPHLKAESIDISLSEKSQPSNDYVQNYSEKTDLMNLIQTCNGVTSGLNESIRHKNRNSSGRSNTRNSLTLDGAIRSDSLEVAMKQDREVLERVVDQHLEEPEIKALHDEETLKIDRREESPLLDNFPSFEVEGPNNDATQKSGFDFLDNW